MNNGKHDCKHEEENKRNPLIGILVKPNPTPQRSNLAGIELSFYIGRRILIAAFATVILTFSLVSVKASKSGTDEILTIENRDNPNLVLSAVALYLLGVSTDLDLTFPLRMIRGNSNDDDRSDT